MACGSPRLKAVADAMDVSLASLADEDAEVSGSEKERSEKRAASPGKEAAEEPPSSKKARVNSALTEATSFKVLASLNLGLNLKIGTAYTAIDLRRKCGDNKQKRATLEKFLRDPTKLAPVGTPVPKPAAEAAKVAPKAPKAKSQATKVPAPSSPKPKAQAEAPAAESSPHSSPGGKRLLAKTAEDSNAKKLVLGQLVWYISGNSTRLANVMAVAENASLPYQISYIAAEGGSGARGDRFECGIKDLRPFNLKDLASRSDIASGEFQLPPAATEGLGTSSLATQAVWVPGIRDSSGPFAVGAVVWYQGSKRPSWPARVQMAPSEEQNTYRVQLFSTRGGSEDGEVVPATSEQLLAFEKDDMPAFYQAAKAVQDAVVKQAA